MKKVIFSLVAMLLFAVSGIAQTTNTMITSTSETEANLADSSSRTHDYVDLGLPSGLLWATCNVGANAPEEYGDYFAWGETQPKTMYNWRTYQHCNGGYNTLIKYCSYSSYGYNGFTDTLVILLPEDDAATANWGNEWRMPTKEEWQELLQNTTRIWTTQNGVNGRLYTASNGNSIFLPAGGSRHGGSLYYVGSDGNYWSSSLYTNYPEAAWDYYFESEFYNLSYYSRYDGFSVRAVHPSTQNLSIITATSNPTEGGEVSGGGSYSIGSTCTLTATANTGYIFINWTENGNQVSTNANYTFTVTGDRTLVANFEPQAPIEFTISVSANPSNGGTVSGGGTYQQGQQCTVTATVETGYTFVNWTENGDQVSTNANYMFTVTGNRTLVANFSQQSYTINASASPSNGGTVTGGGNYNYGQSCTLSATPTNGYIFVNWTENGDQVSTNANYTFTVTGNRTLVANFIVQLPNIYTINVSANPNNGGTVTGGGTYQQGQSCTLTATANPGYTFINWARDGEVVSTVPTFSVTVTESASYVANFSQDSYEITATANPATGGIVTGGGTYNYGATATLTATANTGYTFTNWTKDGEVVSTVPTFSVTVTEAATYVANFSQNTYEITATANPTTGGTVTGGGTYTYGATATMTATANAGYTFVNWTKDGEVVSTIPTFSVTVTESAAYIAHFSQDSYEITATANPTTGGTVTGTGTYNYGATATLTATATAGYTFINWTKEGEVISTTPTFSVTVTEAATYVANFIQNTYEITATANPTTGGTVTGGGTYTYGATATLTATANTGYTFTNWTKDGEVVSTIPTFSVTVTESAAYIAHFSQDSYEITATANPTTGGTVTGTGTYNYGATATLTATATAGYTFINWTKEGEVISTTPTFSVTVTESATYVANFSLNSYEITATANPINGGTVTGAGTYAYGATATLTATANPGNTFINWTKDGEVVSTVPTFSVTVTESANYVAHFSQNSYEITATANPANGGTVTGAGTYTYGATATLTATANAGYTFTNWTRDGEVVSTVPSFSVTVTESANYVANFSQDSYEITATANPTAGGTVTGAGTYTYGATATLTATANAGYAFTNWTRDGEVVSTTPSFSVMVTEAATYVANFSQNTYEIIATANSEAGGTVTGAGTYTYGATATLTATANAGYTFINWTRDGEVVSTVPTFSVTVTESAAYVANFSQDTYEITATANPEAGGTVTGAGTYTYGATVTLTATANVGYTFINWTRDGEVVSTAPSFSVTVTESAAYIAHFSQNSYEITATANPANGGTVIGGGTYNYGATATLTATANAGYTFINWTKDGEVVSTVPSFSITVTESASYVANFSQNSYEITAIANPEAGGTVTGAGTYIYGTTATLTATANAGYTFVNWTRDGGVVSTTPSFSVTVTESAAYVAHFSQNTYEITATANPEAGGTVTGAGTYTYGATATLTATANVGYTFVNWTKDGEVVSTVPTFSVTVTESASYVANFSQNTYEITATANPEAGGTVTGAGAYTYGATATLTATANAGYTFTNWTKDGEVVSTAPTFSVTVTESAAYVANFSQNSYEITATANPVNGGTVTGGGTYTYGATATLTATANTGYTFTNWTKDGEMVSTTPTFNVTVTESAAYVANFSQNSYEITATANPEAGGTVTGTGTYTYGATATLTATANAGYTFINWTKDGNVVSTVLTFDVTVTETAAYVAHFSQDSYEITATANPEAGGTVTGAGTYAYGATATLTATANAGYTFVNWTKDGEVVSTTPSFNVTVTETATYVANFSLNTYEITATANPTTGGTVTGSGTYTYGATATLTATANAGYTFINWTKDDEVVSTVPSFSVTVMESASYIAHFSQNSYEITATANPEAGGTVTGSGTYTYGATATLMATANAGYTFINWTKDGEVVSTVPSFSVTVTESAAYIANFSQDSYEITATANPANGGTVTGGGTYTYGATATLTATANTGYTFTNWTKDGEVVSTAPSFGVTVTESASYVANFSQNSYEITAMANPEAGGTVTGTGTYNYGATATLTAMANAGYTFTNWTKDGEVVSTAPSFGVTVTESASYVANFSQNSYEITAIANPEAGGTVTGTGTYNYGATATLTATANAGYTFINWTKDGEVVSTVPTFSVTVTESATYVANFSQNSYEITATANPVNGGTVTGGGTYNYGSTVTLTATANTGYTFINWIKDGEVVSTTPTFSVTVTETASYVANFSQNNYEITATANPEAGGTVSGAGTYTYGATVTLTATANQGYTFINWTRDGEVVSTVPSFSVTVMESAAYVAHFSPNSYEITATANPEAGGTVTGTGTYTYGATATLTATTNAGYTFINWTKDGEVVSTVPSFSVTVTESASYIAHFSQNSYEITATANPEAGGTVTGTGTYTYGATATLTATANAGYTFINWTKDGEVVSTVPTFSVTVTESASYIAHFSQNSYEITATANPATGGSVTGTGTYTYGATATLTATANTGYTFVNWTKDGEVVSTVPSFSVTVTESATYVANFSQNSYEIAATANPEAGGTVTGAGTYTYGATVTLTATANAGYTFVNWTRDGIVVSTTPTFSVTVTESAAYVANFSQNSYEITATANPANGGTVTGAGTYAYGATVTLTATANTGYTFINWTKDGEVVYTVPTFSVTVTETTAYVANFSQNTYEVTATANPEAGGTVTGAGTYTYGATVTLTATANAGYTFVNWTRDGEVVSTAPSFSVTVTEAATYVANFSQNTYEITVTANPVNGGTVTGAGTYTYGATATLTATANTGYTFVNWMRDGEVVSTMPTFSVTVTESATYVANFSQDTYEITATANPTNGGTVTGAGIYTYGATCTLTATANAGFTFVNWTKDGEVVSTVPSFSVTVTESAAYVANFSQNSYEITTTANPVNGGTVTGGGTYNYGATVTLTATANTGYTFINWTKDGEVVSTTPTFSVTVTESASYVANFSQNAYEITATSNPEAGGTVTGAGTYTYGATATLTATANAGYTFTNWTKDGEVVSTTPTFSVTVTESASYVANFSLNSYEITATANPEAGGTVTGAGTYTYGATATLTATANVGYTFVNWTKDGEVVSTVPTFSVTVTESASYIANFSLNSYEITATANPTTGGTVTGTGIYTYGATVTLTATATAGYTFINWTNDGNVVSTVPSFSVTVTESAAYVANFSQNSYEITATANPEAGGTVTGAGTYTYGATATLTATANTGYTFVNWMRDGEVVSTMPTFSVTVTESATYVANFSQDTYEITATANPANGGTVTGSGTYAYGATCTLTATANAGYTFVNWTKDGEVVSTVPTFSVTVTESAAYVANFSQDSYEITATANPEAGGTVTGAGTYTYGATATLTATANVGYTFVNWTKDGEVVSTVPSFSVTVTETATYVANFSQNSYEITATANPEAGGTVTGGGTYYYGATAILTATANAGYTFVNWTRNGEVVSTVPTFSVTVTESANYVANFSQNAYEITATANPANGGTVTGAGTYTYGATCTLTATANSGYTFVNWTKDGEVVSTVPTFSVTVTESAAYVAHFNQNSYVITTMANPEAGGTTTGSGAYNYGTTVTLIATANAGYTFTNWTKNGTVVSSTPTFTITVTESATYVANFSQNGYEITATANPTNGGTVTGAGTYGYGETCTLTATANSGYVFVNWTKNGTVVSTTSTFSFTVTESASYVAHFSVNSYEITATANPEAGGTTTGSGTYGYGATCTLSATANPGYTFVNWTKNGTVVSNASTFSITVTESATYVAHFNLNSYVITTVANPEVGGTTTGSGAYNYGTTVTLTATANESYTFVNWTKDGEVVSTTSAFSVTVTESATYVANFSLNSYEITATADPADAGTVTGGGTYSHGSTVILTATANNGYTFDNWTKNGNVVSTNATYSFTALESADYVAHFVSSTHVVTTGVNPANGGQASGDGTYPHGASCTVVATPNDGYTFVKWMQDGVQVSTQPSYTFTVVENTHLTAYFTPQNCTITAEASPVEGGEISGAGVYEYGEACTLIATPNADYLFVKWMKEGVQVSTDAHYSFTVTGNAHYTAVFASSVCVVTASADPEEGGTITGAGTYTYGQTVTLTVTPNENYQFINWTENDEIVSEDETYSFEVTGNRNLVAHLMFVSGVDENHNVDISIYPNPTVNEVTVEASQVVNKWEIFTISGSLVYSSSECTDKKEFWVSQLAPGTYVIRMTINNEVLTREFVKKR